MLTSFVDLLATSGRAHSALGAFTCYDLETARGVLSAAHERKVGVVLLISGEAFSQPGGDLLAAAVRAAAERSPAHACVQLDHIGDLDLIAGAFEVGCNAVMADGSRLEFEENAALVADAVALARRAGGSVEAELGHIAGDEDVAVAARAGKLTDPDQAASFVARTGASCLAVSIGNVHGAYATTPEMDWPRLAAIRRKTDVPLSLHGASGLPDVDIRTAVAAGIAKVNVNTELREAYLDETAATLPLVTEGQRLLALHRQQTEAVRRTATEKLAQYAPDTT